MELKANETDKLIKGMSLKPSDDSIKYDWNTEAPRTEVPLLCSRKVVTSDNMLKLVCF